MTLHVLALVAGIAAGLWLGWWVESVLARYTEDADYPEVDL